MTDPSQFSNTGMKKSAFQDGLARLSSLPWPDLIPLFLPVGESPVPIFAPEAESSI
jgi:hypothetical protein